MKIEDLIEKAIKDWLEANEELIEKIVREALEESSDED